MINAAGPHLGPVMASTAPFKALKNSAFQPELVDQGTIE